MKKNKLKKVYRGTLIAIGFLAVVFLILFVIYNQFEGKYDQRIYPGVYIGNTKLGGKTADEARIMLNQRLDELNQDGVIFDYASNESIIYPVINKSPDGDIIDILVDFDIDKTIEKAMTVGRSDNLISDAGTRFWLFFTGLPIDMVFKTNKEKIIYSLKKTFTLIESTNAAYYIENNQLLIRPEHFGEKINYELGINKLNNNLKQLIFEKINLKSNGKGVPEFTQADCEQMKDLAQEIVDLAPVSLKYENNTWALTADILADWIVVSKNNTDKKNPYLFLQLDKSKINYYLENEIEPKIDEPPMPTKFVLRSGRLQAVEKPKTGLELNIFLATENLADLPNNHLKQLNLSVSKILVESQEINNEFGIKEKIGTSTSKIIDSTQKRIYNIKQGASIINGLLISPNEEFSLLKFLSPFNESNGFIKELVIQDGEMVPDYGGGLCQLSTTVFRAVVDAGLPITERRNHSYWLHYYNPPGTDATIFSPAPDLKFINDTGNYILINASVDTKLNLKIDLWGIKDGRIITKTEPIIFNIVYPGDKIVYTDTLPKGVISCLVAAYNGADTYFDYNVTYPDGSIKKTRFNSHYTPHQGICYIGK